MPRFGRAVPRFGRAMPVSKVCILFIVMKPTQLILGVDGGGTQTRTLLADMAGRVLSIGTAGAASGHR